MTYAEISAASGLPLSTVQKVLGGKIKNPRQATLTSLEQVLTRRSRMPRKISIGNQDFETIIDNNYFYVDKTAFIREWWESGDPVTLITRPRRFGKTLNMSMLDCFFSNRRKNSQRLFEGLAIWEYSQYRELQGSYPVISMSFASVKGSSFDVARTQIIQNIVGMYRKYSDIVEASFKTDMDRRFYESVNFEMSDATAGNSLNFLCEMLSRQYGRKVIILLDEYDTPLQEAYVHGFCKEMTAFIRSLFNATFKTNEYLERALMTGITRVSKESIFSDMNNLKVVSLVLPKYETAFGFTREEVKASLEEYGRSGQFNDVKEWYDGFHMGSQREIYNPWSVTQFLDTGIFDDFWANTSGNFLIEKLIREGTGSVKEAMEVLMKGGTIPAMIDEEIVFNLIDQNESGIFSMLLASGYVRIEKIRNGTGMRKECLLALTNREVRHMFEDMVRRWFESGDTRYNEFVRALIQNDIKYMNRFMNDIALNTFSSFDTGRHPSGRSEPERFYHGFVLGLMVDLSGKYGIRSNRESGFGRYDVCMEPRDRKDPAYVLEFKVFDPDEEKDLEITVQNALRQIEEKKYDAELLQTGIPRENIHHYGFAFDGKKVLIGGY